MRALLLLPVLLQLVFVIELRAGQVAADGVNHEEQEGQHQQPQYHIDCNFAT